MEGFTIFDAVVAGAILISAVLAYSRGLVREVMSILGWVAAAIVAFIFAPRALPLMNEMPYLGDFIGGSCELGIMAAFAALAESDVEPRGDVLLTAVVDEEGPYGLGSDRLIRDGMLEDVDAAVVTEPGPILAQSDLDNPALLLGARGRFLYDVTVTGRAAHGSQPHKGVNAVVDAGRVAEALDDLPVASHELLGDGSVCPLKIEGGSQTLSVPESARVMADRHVVPGEDEATVREQAEAAVADLDLDSEVDISFRESPDPGIDDWPNRITWEQSSAAPLTQIRHGTRHNAAMGRQPTVRLVASSGAKGWLETSDTRSNSPTACGLASNRNLAARQALV